MLDKRPRHLIAKRPKELLKIHGVHFQMTFLGRNHDVLDVLLDRHEGAGFHVVIAPVCHKVFDCSARFRTHLNLIKNDHRLAGIQLHVKVTGQVHKQRVQVIQIVRKELLDLIACAVEVNQNIALVFLLRKLLNAVAFAHTARAVDQQRGFSGAFLFP